MLSACENGIQQSCVPSYVVNLSVNTELGDYTLFVPANIYSHMIVDDTGYHFNKKTIPLTIGGDPHGYMGVVIFIDGGGQYVAFDLCCPQCYSNGLRKGGKPGTCLEPLEIDGIFATCPVCGAQYELNCYGVPHSGAREALRQFSTLYSNHILTIRN